MSIEKVKEYFKTKGRDERIQEFEVSGATAFPAFGSPNSEIELSLEELEEYSGFLSWINVCKVIKI